MNRFIYRNMLIASLAAFSSAASINSQAADSEYEQWLKQTQSEFQSYLDENDKAFIGFLNQKWQEVEVEKPVKRDPKPRPSDLPIAQPITLIDKPSENTKPVADKKPTDNKKDIIKPVQVEQPTLSGQPDLIEEAKLPKEKRPEIKERPVLKRDINLRTAKFDFFGEEVRIDYHKKFKQGFRNTVNNKSIADYWKALASQPHQEIIDQLEAAGIVGPFEGSKARSVLVKDLDSLKEFL